ncbi:hypothetical protein EDC01DRAFT_638472 [Geopyxis carbonaria]|nr:hypothetical protein EDC01DRAFT_638472 [Geopyxis carbonaria]
MPKHVPTMSVTKRGIAKVPAYLKGYEPARISRVCSSLLPKPSTVTKTRTVTRVITTTAAAARRTVVVTITPTATVTSTVAPTTTETTTETPTITATTTATVTPTATTTIVATKSVCPDQVNGITGISVTPPGSLRFPFAVTAPDCCTACFNTPGCVAWWSVQNSICAYAINSPPNADGTSAVCPSGRGDWSFFDGGSMDGTQVGGRGPCANNRK